MKEASSAEPGMAAGFHYVLEVFRNASRMLLACDPLLEPYKFEPYSWAIAESTKKQASAPGTWLQNRAVRQYYPAGRKDHEILTVGAYFWDPGSDEVSVPLCIASMMAVHSCPDAVYWLGMLGALSPAPRGDVELIDSSMEVYRKARDDMERYVRDGRILSVAVPLVDVTSSVHLEERLIKPLVARLEKVEGNVHVMPAVLA